MIKKEELEELFHLALSNGGDFAEVFQEEKTTNAYEMLNGSHFLFCSAYKWNTQGFHLILP